MDFSFSTSPTLPNSASPQHNPQAASVFGLLEFSSIEQLPNAKASVAFVPDSGTAFRVDKGGEKLAETEEDLLQHRTDDTDAFDTLYIGCSKFPQNTNFPLNLSGVV